MVFALNIPADQLELSRIVLERLITISEITTNRNGMWQTHCWLQRCTFKRNEPCMPVPSLETER